MNEKLEVEGELFVLVEEDEDDPEDIHIYASVAGVDIWEWLEQHNGHRIKISIERDDTQT